MSSSDFFDAALIKSLLARLKSASDDKMVWLEETEVDPSFAVLPPCCKVKVNLSARNISVWATGKSRDEAAGKSTAELIERVCLRHSYPIIFRPIVGMFAREKSLQALRERYPGSKNWIGATSSGAAVHSSKKQAIQSATSELIERHTVLKALALKVPPFELEAPAILGNYKIPKNVALRFLVWRGALNNFVCVCQVGVNDGAYYAFGTGRTTESASERAFFEAAGMIAHLPNEKSFEDPTIHPGDLSSIMKYHRYSGNRETLEFLSKTSPSIQEVDADVSADHFYYSVCETPQFLGDVRPLVCVRVLCPLLQPLFFDMWRPNYINPAAIPLGDNELPQVPHFIS